MSRRVLSIVVAVAACAAAAGAAVAAGPSPGISSGGAGLRDPDRAIRYVALSSGSGRTVLAAIGTRDGRVLRSRWLVGDYGIPFVTYAGQTEGLSRDGRTLVLSTVPGAGVSTDFAVVGTKTLRVRFHVTLKGIWSYDALSPDARTMYLIRFLPSQSELHYRVRAYDLVARKLVAGAIVDKREPDEATTGFPVARATSADGAWAYTLYQRGGSAKPFIHALDTVHRVAICLDLAWTHSQDALGRARLVLTRDGRTLLVRDSVTGKTLTMVAAPG
jgi:hypothetical protein